MKQLLARTSGERIEPRRVNTDEKSGGVQLARHGRDHGRVSPRADRANVTSSDSRYMHERTCSPTGKWHASMGGTSTHTDRDVVTSLDHVSWTGRHKGHLFRPTEHTFTV